MWDAPATRASHLLPFNTSPISYASPVLILSLPASSGVAWLRDGWRLIKRQPIGLAAMVVIYTFVLFIPVSIPLPYLGAALLCLISPFATLGVMAAFRAVAAGKVPTPGVFIQPLQNVAVRRVLFRLGLIHAGLMIVVIVVVRLINGPIPLTAEDEPLTVESLRLANFAVFTLVYSPVLVAMWFAPLLAGWHGLGPGKAMFGSAVACWRNKGALLVYGLLVGCVMLAVGFVAMLGGILSAQLLPLLSAPLGLAVATLIQASFYPMYRSIFAEPGPAAVAVPVS